MTDMKWSLCRAWLILGSLMIVALGPGAPGSAAGAAPNPSGSVPPEVTLQQVHMIETRDGKRLWEVRADRAEVHEREGYSVLSRLTRPVRVTLYSDQGELTCTANRARVDLRSKDVVLEGRVDARSDQGTELRTESLRWVAASRTLLTDQPVTLIRGNWSSQGRGLEAETDLERVRIFANITSQMEGSAAPTRPGRSARP
jgi:LPS export ABC transporter protein LptC